MRIFCDSFVYSGFEFCSEMNQQTSIYIGSYARFHERYVTVDHHRARCFKAGKLLSAFTGC